MCVCVHMNIGEGSIALAASWPMLLQCRRNHVCKVRLSKGNRCDRGDLDCLHVLPLAFACQRRKVFLLHSVERAGLRKPPLPTTAINVQHIVDV